MKVQELFVIDDYIAAQNKLYIFLPLPDIIEDHFIVLDERYVSPENSLPFWIIRLLTHSSGFNNRKLKAQIIISSIKDLSKSYVSIDRLAILEKNIRPDEVIGSVNLKQIV